MKKLGRIYTILFFAMLYAPIVMMVVFSFNATKSITVFSVDYAAKGNYGFGYWYREFFNNSEAKTALVNSLILAVSSSVLSTVFGTLAALGLYGMRKKWLKATITGVTNIPMMNPDIVTGLSMMLMFGAVFAIAKTGEAGFITILIAHVTFSIPYVILSITPKLMQMDKNLPEAAMDLGCTPISAFFRVELPFIMPAILSGMLTAFTLSLDDYVISLFTTGASFQTLPLYIYGLTKKGVKPSIYALSTVLLVGVFALLLISNIVQSRSDSKKVSKHR